MTHQELDQVYTELAHTLARVGQDRAPLLLSMVCLALLGRQGESQAALEIIRQAETAL
ncbi:hypothetical protein [Bordetella holmesii]|uniref:N-acetyltransferase YedL n=2 Tax=Bordetella holmesii TaxID=35814 RepID=A0ABN0S3K9_9BORD|nr:hypothetical protein [Bordetella holmesii]AHV92328.1 hypothetical protein D560_1694 [Bordetella holmesii ATCC 51541]EWM41964.1 hypothetical protein D556_1698 [Bordetella holmesii 41130]EWM46929.1 hypothetical protein D555_1710 [Bordetella holmesii 35009]EWM51104.1 hypothetical protein D557_0955 [Bordetella holmesii 70147]AMD49188.1 hypothetical protein F783_010430 [Bordetella holmesii F627]